jgi:hypothetical protein
MLANAGCRIGRPFRKPDGLSERQAAAMIERGNLRASMDTVATNTQLRR